VSDGRLINTVKKGQDCIAPGDRRQHPGRRL